MRNSIKTFDQMIAKTLVVTAILIVFGSCNVQKRYHSNGFNFQFTLGKTSVKSSPKSHQNVDNQRVISTTRKKTNSSLSQQNPTTESIVITDDLALKTATAPSPNPPTSSVGVQKNSQTTHFTKHKPYKIPSLEYQNAYNKIVLKAADMDARSFNNFQWAWRFNRYALYSIGIIIATLLLLAVLSIPLTGLGPISRKIFIFTIVGIPCSLELATLASLFAGFVNIELGSLLYNSAINQLPMAMKLRAEASILTARLPYVSKNFTIRTAKNIIQRYQTQSNSSYLGQVEQTLAELQNKNTKVKPDTWKNTKDIGKFIGIALLVTLLFALMP